MKIVFRLKGVGFSLPVVDLLHIQELSFGSVAEVSTGTGSVGVVDYNGMGVPIYDPAPLFYMGRIELVQSPLALIVTGDNGPFAILIDKVDGIFAAEQFVSLEVPPFLLSSTEALYTSVDILNGEPLVHCNPGLFSRYLEEA